MKNYKTLGVLMAASLALINSAHADFNWTGATSTDPTVSTNWSTTPPTVNAANSGSLFIANGTTGQILDYTSADGTTSFSGDLRVGSTSSNGGAAGSEMDVSGGSLTILNSGNGTNTIGYNGSGTVGVSGGTLTVDGTTDTYWFANTYAATANVSGTGQFIINDQVLFSRQGATATVNLSGSGVMNLTSTKGSTYNTNGGNGTVTINIGGNGIFEQTGSGTISLSTTFAATPKFTIDFGAGSMGEFSLLGDSTSTLDSYITAGDFYIAGAQDTSLSDYQVIGAANSSSQGIIELAAVPEPSTWAMLLGSVLVLLGVQRLSRNRTV